MASRLLLTTTLSVLLSVLAPATLETSLKIPLGAIAKAGTMGDFTAPLSSGGMPLPTPHGPAPFPFSPDPFSPALYPLDAYRLTVGDIVYVIVANVPDYSGTAQVLPDGSLNLPVLGRVDAWGKTLSEVAQTITQGYTIQGLLVEPRVTVTLSQISPVRVVITGEVSRPGAYTLEPSQGRLPTVAVALDAAGGITQRTDLRAIQVRRVAPNNREAETLTVSLWDLLVQGDGNQDISLRDGDTIVVPRSEGVSVATVRQLTASTFAGSGVQVNLVGEIARPGVMEVPPDTPLSEALLLAGSFTPRSRQVDVQLLRLNPDGTISQRTLPVDFAAPIDPETNPLLEDRDVIIVGRNFSASVGDTIGSVLQPLSGAFSLFNLFLPFLLVQ